MTTPQTTIQQADHNRSGVMTPLEAHVSAVHGTSPGPASGITYDVAINQPGGNFLATEVAPADARIEDTDVFAAPVGSPVVCYLVGQNYTLLFAWQEMRKTAQCSDGASSQFIRRLLSVFKRGSDGS